MIFLICFFTTCPQHGDRKSAFDSTSLQIEALSNGEQRDSVLLDFSKAFDKVSHRLILHRLAYYGIKHEVLNWIKDFLSNREQTVVVGRQCSSPADVTSAGTQGSVIGPLLFLLNINDLPDYVKHSSTSLIADDSVISRTIHNQNDAALLQKVLDNLQKWERT